VSELVAGDVEIGDLIGEGASGCVYRGTRRSTGATVAVKILHRDLCSRREMVARFEREARIAQRLRHPNVVLVHEAGRRDDGILYIVMEHLDGVSLRAALDGREARTAIGARRALRIALQICDACAAAHDVGIVHRDLKPENVILVGDDFVKVLDFGIAKSNRPGTFATAAGAIFGTARYMSPEAAQSARVGPPSDVYAIATMLYEMLAGRTPFEADEAIVMLVKQVHDPPPDVRAVAGRPLPDALARVIMQNLAKDPAARCADARALREALLSAREDDVPRERRRVSARLAIAAAFVVGAAGATSTTLVKHAADAKHESVVAQTRAALVNGRLTAPAGDDVADLVASGLARWPDDPALLALRADAAQRLVTRAMVRRAGGDVEGARDTAAKALRLEPNDHSARTLLDRYDHELGDAATSTPRIILHVPRQAHAGETIAVSAQVVVRGTPKIERPRVAVATSRDAPPAAHVSVRETTPLTLEARFAASGPGRLRVVIDASVDGRPLHAERTVVVDG
jgi:serine/threonine-protein kinase